MAPQAKENLTGWARPIDWISPIGGNWIFWTRNAERIRDLIQAHGLNPLTLSDIPAITDMVNIPTSVPERPDKYKLKDLGIPGGIRVPHLHFQDGIYMLDNKQWAKFSKEIVDNFKTALTRSKVISFEQTVVLGSIAQTLGKG